MLDWAVKLYYRIPKPKWRNPIRLENRDSREFEWFLERRKYGFDERAMWHLGPNFVYRIRKFLNLESSSMEIDYLIRDLTLDEFECWVEMRDAETLKWMTERLALYIEWQCPTFYTDENHRSLPDATQKEILQRVANTLNDMMVVDKCISSADIKFVYDHVFHLGW